MLIRKILADERGSQFLEIALWIVLFTLVVAVGAQLLGGETSSKFEQLTDRVSQLGTP